jgi:hypothetical protein
MTRRLETTNKPAEGWSLQSTNGIDGTGHLKFLTARSTLVEHPPLREPGMWRCTRAQYHQKFLKNNLGLFPIPFRNRESSYGS